MTEEDPMAELAEFRAFVETAESGSLTSAAIRLDQTQSTVSRRLLAFEARLGGRLFLRTGRGVRLTELGLSLLPQVRRVLADADGVIHDARRHATEPSGTVSLGILPSVSRPLVRQLFQAAREQFPRITLTVMEGFNGELTSALDSGTVDLAILNRYGRAPNPGEELLARTSLVLVGARGDRHTLRPLVPFSALDNLPLILPSPPNALRAQLETIARRRGVRLNETMTANSLALLRDIVADGECCTIMPDYAVAHEVARGRLQASRIVQPSLNRLIVLGRSGKGRFPAVAKHIARLVRQLFPRCFEQSGTSHAGDR